MAAPFWFQCQYPAHKDKTYPAMTLLGIKQEAQNTGHEEEA